jgi:hypothetical protein
MEKAMLDPFLVRGIEGIRDLPCDVPRVGRTRPSFDVVNLIACVPMRRRRGSSQCDHAALTRRGDEFIQPDAGNGLAFQKTGQDRANSIHKATPGSGLELRARRRFWRSTRIPPE